MTTDIKTTTKTPIAVGSRGVEIRSLEDLYRFSQYVAASGLAPKGIDKPESILVALQMGMELGLTPMQSLQNVAVINGRPSLWGDAMLGVCRASGVFDDSAFSETIAGDGESMVATVTVARIGGKPHTVAFSVSDAKRASLWGKAGPWQQYPQRMLKMRARAFALRDTFPDFLKGISSAEEASDIDTPAQTALRKSHADRLADHLESRRIVEPETAAEPVAVEPSNEQGGE